MSRRLVHVTTVPMTLHFLAGQPRFMTSLGWDVHVVSSGGPDMAAFLKNEPEVTAHVLPMWRDPALLRDAVAIARMIARFRALRPRVVHTHTPKAGLLAVVAARLTGVPLVIHHIHGGVWLAAGGVRRQVARLVDRVTCALAHHVLCVSRSVREELVREGLCPPDKVEVLLQGSINGVDAEGRFDPACFDAHSRRAIRQRHGIPSDALVVGFVGRLTGEKGIVELSTAWQRLRERHDRAHLLLVGPEDEVVPLSATVSQQLRSDSRVHFVGMDWNTPPLYAAMDVFVLPTYREGFPVVLLEAAAMGLPAVATTVPGCIDAIDDGVTGILVPARDAEGLGDAIDAYLQNADLRHRHGRAARRRALNDYRPELMWHELALRYRGQADKRLRATSLQGDAPQ